VLRFLTLVALLSAVVSQQQAQLPTFRSSRELLTVDASIRDSAGRPITDLTPADFTVRIDGQIRRVATAHLFGARDQPVTNQSDPIPRFSRAVDAAPGRIVLLVIDRDSMRPGTGRAALETAASLVEQLSPPDAVGVVSFPGRAVELTRDHKGAAAAIRAMTGTAPKMPWTHMISWEEALAFGRRDKLTTSKVIERECSKNNPDCSAEVSTQAADMLVTGRARVDGFLAGLRSVLDALAPLRAPKRIVIVSAGLPYDMESLSRFDALVESAAKARVALTAIHLDQPDFDASSTGLHATETLSGREYAAALANLASATGGEFFSAVGAADGVFARVATDITTFYEIGVESKPSDANGSAHRVDVKVAREKATVRAPARTTVLPGDGNPDNTLRHALAEPTDVAELPIEVAPYVTYSPDRDKVRVIVAVQLAGAEAAPASWGYVVIKEGKEVAADRVHVGADAHAPWTASSALDLPPGRYRLRTAVAASDGRIATLEVPLVAELHAAGAVTMADLIVGTVDGGAIQPRARLRQDEAAVGMIELSSRESLADAAGSLVLTRGGTRDQALRVPLTLRTRGDDKSVIVAEAAADISSLPAGPYTASAVVTRGGAPIAQINRVFEIVSGRATTIPAATVAPRGKAPATDAAVAETMARVGRYASSFGQEASLIVGVEHYDQELVTTQAHAQLRRRKTVAEFALIKTADALGWAGFRDIIEVDGKRVGDRADRLQTLFRSGADNTAEARRIADESARFNIGPARRNFNEPTAALFFFTPPMQSRFVFTKRRETVTDGKAVWEIDYQETARPTLIRTSNGKDVPAQGTIWVIADEGTVIRTRLVISGFSGLGSSANVDVTYARDARLELWLPVTMRERDDSDMASMEPSSVGGAPFSAATGTAKQQLSLIGTATYGDYKRFQTSATVKIK
jgi:VWFA-related protein